MAELTLTTRRPKDPVSDFAFYIDFKKGEGSASRVFSATHEFIRACERLDRDLVASIDASIETVMVLEDIEAKSLKTWLRSTLKATDDQALKDINWKPLVGKYLVRAKYMVLGWMDDDNTPKNLPDLRRELQKLASETDVRRIPDYAPISPSSLIDAIRGFESVKDHLVDGDVASLDLPDGESIEFNISARINVDDIEAFAIKETQTHRAPCMVLQVRKPDYLGASMWEFRLGKRPLLVKIEDEDWLEQFQSRKVDVRPGDAIKCAVRIEMMYGHDSELIREKHYIEKVQEVLVRQDDQFDLPLLGDSGT